MSNGVSNVREVWRTFLRLGLTAFGGPAAHISAMDDEFVRRRAWLTRAEFADLLSASQLLPGPSSTELAMLIGYRRASWGGLVAAGLAFIVPAVVLVWGLAWVYARFGDVVQVVAVMRGVRPVVCAVLAVAVWRLATQQFEPHHAHPSDPQPTPQRAGSVRQRRAIAVGGVVAVSVLLRLVGVHELVVLGIAALAMLAGRRSAGRVERALCGALAMLTAAVVLLPRLAAPAGALALANASQSNGAAPAVVDIGWSFLRIGSTVFGSGYVLVAYLRSAFVDGRGWLTESQLVDAIAVGQVTPGPVFATATFIGYLLAGNAGALTATLGIFLPAFLFAAIAGLLVPKLRTSDRASTALDGLNAGSLALLGVVLLTTARESLNSPLGLAIAAAALALLLLCRLSALWVLLGGAVVGFLSPYAGAFGVTLLRTLSF